MSKSLHSHLSRRERQIMDVLFEQGEASAQDVLDKMPNPPGYSSVRVMLRILEEKGHVRHRKDGRKFVYTPTVAPEKAEKSALKHVLHTFFGGSAPRAMAALLDTEDLTQADLDTLANLIEKKKQEEG